MRGIALLGYGGLVVIAVAIDQAIKILVQREMALYERIDVLPFLALFRTTNTGVAFSMLSWIGDRGLILATLAIIAFVGFMASRTAPHQRLASIGFALILGGAIGNLIDRSLYGHVVDYVLFHTPVWSFAVFNLADAFISIGAGLVILEEFTAWRREAAARPED